MNREIVEYNVAASFDPESLFVSVKGFVADWYTLQGGICMTVVNEIIIYAQAMVK